MKSSYNVVIENRALELGKKFVLCKGATVRSIARETGISKTTVHNDLTERLKNLDNELYLQARKKLDQNKTEAPLRGGNATKQKILNMRQSR